MRTIVVNQALFEAATGMRTIADAKKAQAMLWTSFTNRSFAGSPATSPVDKFCSKLGAIEGGNNQGYPYTMDE